MGFNSQMSYDMETPSQTATHQPPPPHLIQKKKKKELGKMEGK